MDGGDQDEADVDEVDADVVDEVDEAASGCLGQNHGR